MLHRCFGLIVLVAGLSCAPGATAQGEADPRSGIQRQYDKMADALMRRDQKSYVEFLLPGALAIEITGEEKSAVAVTKENFDIFVQIKDLAVQIKAESAVVTAGDVRVTVRKSYSGLTAAHGSSRVRVEEKQTDTWTRVDGVWRIRSTQSLEERTWVGDKLVLERNFEPPLTPEVKAAVLADIARQAHPLRSVDADNGDEDLEAFGRMIGDARIVSLGEGTHGTSEFFRMKHRLLKYLVEKKGFTVLAFEQNWFGARTVDRFIKGGKGDATDAVRAMHEPWLTTEIRDTIAWMREYNDAHAKRPALSFYGFDMQTPESAPQCVMNYIGRVSPADKATFEQLYAGFERANRFQVSRDEFAQLHGRATEALRILDEKRASFAALLTQAQMREMRACAFHVVESYRLQMSPSGDQRDHMMAQSIHRAATTIYPNRKIVLWAHNGHIAASDTFPAHRPMGRDLRETFGDEMVVVGFANDKGEVRALPMKDLKPTGEGFRTMILPAPQFGSIEALLADVAEPIFALDLRRAPPGSPLATYLARARAHRILGFMIDPDMSDIGYNGMLIDLPKAYDIMIYIARSTAAQPVPRREVRADDPSRSARD